MDEERAEKRVPIEFQPDNSPSVYATNLIVQHSPNEFYLRFFETKPPLLLGTPIEQIEQMEQIQALRALPVATIIVPASRMEEFVNVLQTNLDRYKATSWADSENHEEIEEDD